MAVSYTHLFRVDRAGQIALHTGARMGAGQLGVREEIYKNPLHPYTKGLLSCIPIADPKLARACLLYTSRCV